MVGLSDSHFQDVSGASRTTSLMDAFAATIPMEDEESLNFSHLASFNPSGSSKTIASHTGSDPKPHPMICSSDNKQVSSNLPMATGIFDQQQDGVSDSGWRARKGRFSYIPTIVGPPPPLNLGGLWTPSAVPSKYEVDQGEMLDRRIKERNDVVFEMQTLPLAERRLAFGLAPSRNSVSSSSVYQGSTRRTAALPIRTDRSHPLYRSTRSPVWSTKVKIPVQTYTQTRTASGKLL